MLKKIDGYMKIAIVGAGWYGCSIALELAKDIRNSSIDIYDMNSDIFKGAASNNQHRIHHGFHYPRSIETINEISNSYFKFMSKYSDLVYKTKNNYYLIEKNSITNFSDYVSIYKNMNIDFKEVNKNKLKNFINLNYIEGAILTNEEIINKNLSYRYFKSKIQDQKNIILKLNTKITNINNLDYDFIINCTYTNPNLGINSESKKFDIKYEMCVMPIINNIFKKDICFTIMDGSFISIYQNNEKDLIISGVEETPHLKTLNLNELNNYIYKSSNTNNLLEHCSKYFKDINKNTKIKDLYISPKVKIKNDINSLRISKITRDGNVISVLCGKISSIVSIYELIKKEIEDSY